MRSPRFRFLFESPDDSQALSLLENGLQRVPCHYKLVKVPRSNVVRLLVKREDFLIACRVLGEIHDGYLKSGPHPHSRTGSGKVVQ